MIPTQSDHLKGLAYRPEIDGLRAIAVLTVILFHAGANFPGGFVGVDIFYVISGFLITRIILIALQNDSFSFADFYARRVRRLLPAALCMVLTTVLFGYWMLAPDKYVELAKSAIYASVFLANVWFANHSGYFDQAAEVSPLVHMWSLSVEEQFYLFFPLLLVLCYKFCGMRGLQRAVLGVLALSLLLSLVLSESSPNFAFYLLPTRAWELCVGGMLAFFPLRNFRNAVAPTLLYLIGMALIIYSVFFFNQDQVYPGWLATLPVVGSALLIVSAHSNRTIGSRLLKSRALVLIGKFSYSAYLWHWPIVSYYRIYVAEREFRSIEVVALVLASLGAGFLSWKFIEERFRYRQLPTMRVLTIGAGSIAFMAFAPLIVSMSDGFPNRWSDHARAISDEHAMWDWSCTERRRTFESFGQEFCVVGEKWDEARVKGVIWGDSHSLHWAQIFHQLALERGMSLVITPEECPPYLDSAIVREHYPDFPRFTEDCTLKHRTTIDWLKTNAEVELIIMAAAWSGHVRMLYTDNFQENLRSTIALTARTGDVGAALSEYALRETLAKIDLQDRHVLLLSDMPRPNRNLNDCALADVSLLLRADCDDSHRYLDAPHTKMWHQPSDDVLTVVASEMEQVEAIIPVSILCGQENCPTYVNGELLYKDNNHIRRNLAPSTVEQLADELGLTRFLSGI